MTTPFFSTKELDALRDLTVPSMTTTVLIQHRVVTQNTYGDDIVSYANGDTVKGWMFSTPTPMQEEDSGSLITANTYRLFVPVGTNIDPGDQVVIDTETFLVSDTTFESTWNVMLRCSLRRRE
jgi:hypothetical protein